MDRILAFSAKSFVGIILVLLFFSGLHYGLSLLNIGVYSSDLFYSARTVTASVTTWVLDALNWVGGLVSTPTAPSMPSLDSGTVGKFE